MARIQIEMNDDALKALDAEAARQKCSRESFVADAVAAALAAKPHKPAPKKAAEPKD